MSQTTSHEKDHKSCLAQLSPSMPWEFDFRRIKNTPRLHGSYITSLKRASRDMESSRPYSKGDPLNLIDWKAFARTDQLIVREKRDEAAVRIGIICEAGDTMFWPQPEFLPGVANIPPQKFEVALRIALHLGYSHLRAGDILDVWLTDDALAKPNQALKLSPKSPSDILSLFRRLSQEGFAKEKVHQEFFAEAYGIKQKRYDRLYWIGDLLESGSLKGIPEIPNGVATLLHVLSSFETEIEWMKEDLSYFDEANDRREYQGEDLKRGNTYLTSIGNWRRKLEADFKGRGGNYMLLTDKTPTMDYINFLAWDLNR